MAFAEAKRILITGANGFVGREINKALESAYEIHLVDISNGVDEHNRFAHEKASATLCSPLATEHLTILDLAKEGDAFEALLDKIKPDLVIHCAGILENQKPSMIREVNTNMNRNVLEACAKRSIALIPMSSIMVMYGAAMADSEVTTAFKGCAEVSEAKRLTIETVLENTTKHIRTFNSDSDTFLQNLAYIQTKEALEHLAKALCYKYDKATIIPIRLGWTGPTNPYITEEKTKPVYTEATVYLAPADFILLLKA